MVIQKVRTLKLDLGIKQLVNEWVSIFSPKYFMNDLYAAVMVLTVALPLSLAIAMASDVPPFYGLLTSIVAGLVCALFGSSAFAMSGPAAALAVIIGSTVEQFGLGAMAFIGFVCGLLQLFSGVFGWGRFAKYIPTPVVSGFVAGIGVIIFIGQLPKVLGLPAPDEAHVLDVIQHIGDYFHKTNPVSLTLALVTVTIIFVIARRNPKQPSILVAVAVPTLIAAGFKLDVSIIGDYSLHLPEPKLPLAASGSIFKLFGTSLIVFLIASLESLLSVSALEKLTKTKHDPNQELIGQGLGNLIVSIFGAMPMTGAISRSSLNVHAGAKTRRASLLLAAFLFVCLVFLHKAISWIPVSVLAAVLIAVSFRMINFREFIRMSQNAPSDALIFAVTLLLVVFVDLIVGVQAGFIAALAILALRLSQSEAQFYSYSSQGAYRFSLDGPLTFMSASEFIQIQEQLQRIDQSRGIILDMSGVTSIDASGASLLIDLYSQVQKQSISIAFVGVREKIQKALIDVDDSKSIEKVFVVSEADANNLLSKKIEHKPMDRLFYGVEKFKQMQADRYDPLFEKLAEGQTPHTLFITCSDSRINPNLITSTDPGELFIVRNVGNIIPPSGTDDMPAEGAALEFAIDVLGVKEVVVCGHSGCGAVKAMVSGQVSDKYVSLKRWLADAGKVIAEIKGGKTVDEVAMGHVAHQLQNLKTHPIIKEKVASGQIRLHAWFYDIGKSELEVWDDHKREFAPIGKH